MFVFVVFFFMVLIFGCSLNFLDILVDFVFIVFLEISSVFNIKFSKLGFWVLGGNDIDIFV